MKKFTIYQISDFEKCPYVFLCWSLAKEKFNFNDYAEVYSVERDYDLNDCFREFNINHPEDYTGHSLSVSDIVKVDDKYFYCDSFGWKEINI